MGIDPGKTGALAMRSLDGLWRGVDCPLVETSTKTRKSKTTGKVTTTVKKESSPVLMAELIRDVMEAAVHKDARFVVYVEKVSAMPGQGVTSMFSFGRNFGQWEGAVAALGCEIHYVTPQRWKKVMLADAPKGKEASRMKALQLFPYLAAELKRKKDNGRAEALLIGEYGRRAEST
jgi:crossover junction endodeoxyribonuclease RuvC